MKTTIDRIQRRKTRVRKNIVGTKTKPRLSVFRSNKYIYIQAFDDASRVTVCSYSSLQIKSKEKTKKTENAKAVGKAFGEVLLKKGIKQGVFDRNRYAYKGRVKAVAEGIREAGLSI